MTQIQPKVLFRLIYPKIEALKNELNKIVRIDDSFEEKFEIFIRKAIDSDYHQFVLTSFPNMTVLFQGKNKDEMDDMQTEIIAEFTSILKMGIEEEIVNESISLDYLSHQILSSINPLLYSILVNQTKK